MEIAGELAANAQQPIAVAIVENILLPTSEVHIRQRLPQRIGDLGHIELLFPVRAQQDHGGHLKNLAHHHIAPRIMRLLFNGSVDGLFEGEVVLKGGIAHVIG